MLIQNILLKKFFTSKQIKNLLFLGFFSFALRVIYSWAIISNYGNTQMSDFLYMHKLAQSLSLGQGFRIDGVWIFNQSFGYPLFMSFFYKLFAVNLNLAIFINIILGTISVLLLYIFSLCLFREVAKLLPGVKAQTLAFFSGFLAAIYPDSLLYTPLFAAENFLIPIMLLICLMLIKKDILNLKEVFVLGFLLALAAAIKAYVFFFFIFIPIIWLVEKKKVVINTFFLVLTAVVFLLPWIYINYGLSSGKIIPFAVCSGTAFLDGTNPDAQGKPTSACYLSKEEMAGKNEIELNSLRMKKAISYIKADKVWYLKLLVKKFLYFFSPVRDFMFQNQGENRFFNQRLSLWLPTLFNLFLIVGIILGIALIFKLKVFFVLGVSLFSTPLILSLVFFAYSRYRFPFFYILIPYTVLSVIYIINFFTRRER